MTWRTGTKLGRTLYRDERLVGMVDTPELAAEIVERMNAKDYLPEVQMLYAAFRPQNVVNPREARQHIENLRDEIASLKPPESTGQDYVGTAREPGVGLRCKGCGALVVRVVARERDPLVLDDVQPTGQDCETCGGEGFLETELEPGRYMSGPCPACEGEP